MSKTISLEELYEDVPAEDRTAMAERGRQLIRAETLRQLRALAGKNQVEVSQATGISQHNVSRLEHRDDMLLSSLDRYVRGLGGRLKLVAELPDLGEISLDLPLGDVDGDSDALPPESPKATSARRVRRKSA